MQSGFALLGIAALLVTGFTCIAPAAEGQGSAMTPKALREALITAPSGADGAALAENLRT